MVKEKVAKAKTAIKKKVAKDTVETVTLKPRNPMQKDIETVSPVWSWCNKFRELFAADPEIEVGINDPKAKNPIITLIVKNEVKALCIEKIIPKTMQIGNNTITINVEIANHFGGEKYLKDIVYEAFRGNPLFDYQYWWEDPEDQTNPYCWVTMKPEAIFWPESNLNNVWGDSFDLPCNIAKEVIDPQTDHIFFDARNPGREVPDHNTRYFN